MGFGGVLGAPTFHGGVGARATLFRRPGSSPFVAAPQCHSAELHYSPRSPTAPRRTFTQPHIPNSILLPVRKGSGAPKRGRCGRQSGEETVTVS